MSNKPNIVKEILKEPITKELMTQLQKKSNLRYIKAIRIAETMQKLIKNNRDLKKQYKDNIKEILTACLLLDIGYLNLPDKYVDDTISFTAKEYKEIKKHVKYGVAIANEYGYSEFIQEIIKKHHERFDGTGYPLGIKLDCFDITSEIAICDVFVALILPARHRRSKINYSFLEAANILRSTTDYYFSQMTISRFMNYIYENMEDDEYGKTNFDYSGRCEGFSSGGKL